MASFGGEGTDHDLPCPVAGGVRGSTFSSFFGSGSSRGGGDEGGSPGDLRSPWISRLRPPPPPPKPLFLPAPESGTSAGTPAVDLRGHAFLGERPSPSLPSPLCLLSRDAAAAASLSSHMLKRQQRGAEVEQGRRRREVGQGRGGMVTGFGPFQVTPRSAPFPSMEGLRQQQEPPNWRMEGEKAGGSGRRSCRPAPDAFPGTGGGNCKSSIGDGCSLFFQGMARLGEVGEVVERDGGVEGLLLAEDERGGVSTPTGTGLRDAVNSHGVRLREASFFRQRGTLCMSPSIRIPGDMGNRNAVGSSQIIKNNQWLRRHRWGEDSKLLDYYPASASWSVGNESVTRPRVPGSFVGLGGLVDEASRRRLRGQRIMASAQGTAYKDTTVATATTRMSYRRKSTARVSQLCSDEAKVVLRNPATGEEISGVESVGGGASKMAVTTSTNLDFQNCVADIDGGEITRDDLCTDTIGAESTGGKEGNARLQGSCSTAVCHKIFLLEY